MSFVRRGSLCLAAALLLCAAFPAFGQRATRKQIGEWTRLLRSDDPQKRSSAATSLVAADDEAALKILLEALQPEQSETIRISVITAFGVQADDRACAPIIAALADPSEGVRQAARNALQQIHTAQSVRLLEQAAGDLKRPLLIRVQSVNLLGDLRAIEAIQTLIKLLSDADEAVRTASRAALESITLRHFNAAREWLDWWRHSSTLTREEMLQQLDQLQAERIESLSRVLEKLYLKILDDPKNQNDATFIDALTQCDLASVKKRAIKGLTPLRGEPVRTALINALAETDASVRQAAADALAAQADAAAVPALLKAANDPESSVRAAAAHALGVLKAREAVTPLIAMLSDADVEAAVAAANALAELADLAALDKLISIVSDSATPAPLYDAAANALAKMQNPRAVPILIKLLGSPKENIRWASADALGGLGVADAVKPLATVALKDQNPQIREVALASLSKIGDPSALDTLVDALSDKEKRVADQALRSLTQVADTHAALYASALDRLVTARSYDKAATVMDSAVAQFGPNNAQATAGLRQRLAAGFMNAKEWAHARTQLEALVAQSSKEPQYIKQLVACLNAQADYDALLARLLQARKAAPDLADYCWQQTVLAVEQIAASDARKTVAAVNALEKDTPDLGGGATAARLRELRTKAGGPSASPAAPTAAPVPATSAAPISASASTSPG
jgi:HEAT repeat protein